MYLDLSLYFKTRASKMSGAASYIVINVKIYLIGMESNNCLLLLTDNRGFFR